MTLQIDSETPFKPILYEACYLSKVLSLTTQHLRDQAGRAISLPTTLLPRTENTQLKFNPLVGHFAHI